MIKNQSLNPDFIEYLEVNGYQQCDGVMIPDRTYFVKPGSDKAISFKHDKADFMQFIEEIPGQWRGHFAISSTYDGLSRLDIFKFMLLMHITDIVPLKDMIRKAGMTKEFGTVALFS